MPKKTLVFDLSMLLTSSDIWGTLSKSSMCMGILITRARHGARDLFTITCKFYKVDVKISLTEKDIRCVNRMTEKHPSCGTLLT